MTRGPKNKYSTSMLVIGGNAPRSEFTAKSMREIEVAGAMPRRTDEDDDD